VNASTATPVTTPVPGSTPATDAGALAATGAGRTDADTSTNGDGGVADATMSVESENRAQAAEHGKKTFSERAEAFISRLSSKNHFWQVVCSRIWLPLAFKSGIRMKKIDASTFTAVLPFRRFNRNWYNAMAGGALLANSEIAGGMYVFGRCGGDYTVVCKNLEYKFLRPCFGPAIYKITPRENLDAMVATGKEFNLTIDMNIVQGIGKKHDRERRVGVCVATFHVTPKAHHKSKKERREAKAKE
jgi:acyl-coenzyme A thioesterase PaaI-like protein